MEQNNQYDFITNPQTPQKSGGIGLGNMNKKKLALLGGGGLLALMLIVSVIASMTSKGPTNQDHLLAVASLQNELIRVSDVALGQAKSTDARNLAITTKLSLRSDQSALTAVLKAQKVKIPKSSKSAKTDQMLTEATQNNRFDIVYMEFTQKQLGEYQKKLNTAYKTTINKKLKAALQDQYKNASILAGVDPEL